MEPQPPRALASWPIPFTPAVLVKTTPTPLTAALAGIVAALAWPHLWSAFGGPQAGGSIELIVSMLLVIALPAHAFVVGFGHSAAGDGRSLDTALLKRIGAWLAAAGATTAVASVL